MSREELFDLLIRVYYGHITVPRSTINTVLDLDAFKALFVNDLNWGMNEEEAELSKLRTSYKIAESLQSLEIAIAQSRIFESLSLNVSNRECVLYWLLELELK